MCVVDTLIPELSKFDTSFLTATKFVLCHFQSLHLRFLLLDFNKHRPIPSLLGLGLLINCFSHLLMGR